MEAMPARWPTRTWRDSGSASAPSRNSQPRTQKPATSSASAGA